MEHKPKIVFIVGMHRCGTSLLSSCLVQNSFSIGKTKNQDKNWQNPNGYFENDSFTDLHNELLSYNKCDWLNIRQNKMVYTQKHIIKYRELLKKEFANEQLILIKDPRLTFFVDFLKKVCLNDYNIHFLFLRRNKNECCKSLSKAQNKSYKKCEILYDITMKHYSDEFLNICHRDIIFNNDLILSKIADFCKFKILNKTNKMVDLNLYRNVN